MSWWDLNSGTRLSRTVAWGDKPADFMDDYLLQVSKLDVTVADVRDSLHRACRGKARDSALDKASLKLVKKLRKEFSKNELSLHKCNIREGLDFSLCDRRDLTLVRDAILN